MTSSPPPALRLRGISKSFGSLRANDGISLDLARGEVLALLGENGAGKSTLMSILFGHYVADQGSIEVGGKRLPPGQPRAALAAGIGMVHQHFSLALNLSVLDNVMLGTESLWRWRSDRAGARARLLQQGQRFGLQVDPEARVADLSVGERQRVEILKALVRGAQILILDEPTAVLTPQESESLFATLAQMVAQGLAVIFISHKLDEVLRVSHRIAVLRGGRLVAELPTAGANKAQLARAMVGREVAAARRVAASNPQPVDQRSVSPCVLLNATVQDNGGRLLLNGVNLELRAGEVLAVAGVSGNGQAVLADVLCGERALTHGRLLLAGRAIATSPRAFVQASVARVPEDRHAVGAIGDLTLWENTLLERCREPAFVRWSVGLGLLNRAAAMAWTKSLLQRFDVRGAEAAGVATPARALSGGNLQKLILARVLGTGRTPAVIVASQPTWGLDIGAVAYVHQQLLDAAVAGAAVLVISEDLDEVWALADRVAVMHQGRLGEAKPLAQWSLQDIGLAMAGQLLAGDPTAEHDRERADAAP